jgi:DNA invertase Pin-like site-specific DNA recombinase
MNGRFISYLRVSTQIQDKSGLGLEAQRAAVSGFLNGRSWELMAEFVEVESGENDQRPKLVTAINRCWLTGATLLVAKLDRLSRDAAFLMSLSKSGIDIRACDLPEANTMMFGIMAVIAQHEREAISKRTKEALTAAQARGTIMGGYRGGKHPDAGKASAARVAKADAFAAMVGPMIQAMKADRLSLDQIADKLTEDRINTVRGGQWTKTAVKNVLDRLARSSDLKGVS